MYELFHGRMAGNLSRRLALRLGLPDGTAKLIRLAVSLHDVGKFKVAREIVMKPGKLTPDEYEVMKLHTVYGRDMLSSLRGPAAHMIKNTAYLHHERWDGAGYWGLPSEYQPVYVRIAGIVDVYCALREVRPYKPAWKEDEAIEYIGDNAGTQFDPRLTEVFIPLAREFDFTAADGGMTNTKYFQKEGERE